MDTVRIIIYLCLGFLLIGCGSGNGEGLDPNGQPATGNTATPLVADFASIQNNVFTPVCTVCHAGASAPLGLRLDTANSYTALVNVSSVQSSAILRVKPGDPNGSYLIAKLEGNASVGGQMPLGGPALPQSTIDVIRQWITSGAPPPSTAPPPLNQPPTVVSSTPADATTMTSLPTTINVAFSQDMDATSVNSTTVILQRSGGDANFTNGNEVTITPASMTLSAPNPALLTISLSGVASVDDSYRLKLVGTGSAMLQDLNSNALDGDNDGNPGGDHLISFTVQSPGGSGLQPTWRSIQDNIFTTTCVVCHSGSGAPEGLQLDEANSYTMLVNIASQQEPTTLRVAPNNANNSYLIHKLEGTAASGSQMPRGGPALSQATIDIIRQWIDAGAPQGNTQPPPPPPGNSDLNISLNIPANASRGDEFTASANIQNNGGSAMSNLSVALTWLPQSSLRIRSGDPTQSISNLNAGQSITLSWTLRADDVGNVALTATVTDSNSQTMGTGNASITISN